MGRLAVQALEGARKAITNTNAPIVATNWYVANPYNHNPYSF